MTFLEAAVEVLRREGKPLHFKELTRLAIKYDLLSVVGRDPESMMQTRLQAEVRRPSSDLVRTIPGVFGLRNYPPKSGRGEPARAEGTSAKSAASSTAQLELPSSDAAAKAGSRERGRRRGRGGRAGEGTATPAGNAAAPATAAASASEAAPPASAASRSAVRPRPLPQQPQRVPLRPIRKAAASAVAGAAVAREKRRRPRGQRRPADQPPLRLRLRAP